MAIGAAAVMVGPPLGRVGDTTPAEPHRIIKTGHMVIDLGRQRVLWKGQPVEVDATELRLLELLAPLVGSPVPREYRLADDWGPGYERDLDKIKRSLWSLHTKTEDYVALRRVLWTLRRRMNTSPLM